MGDAGRRMFRAMGLPDDLSKNVPRIELLGRHSLRVENFSHIIEYTDRRLLLSCSREQLEVTGSGFRIRIYTREELLLEGEIGSVCFRGKGETAS